MSLYNVINDCSVEDLFVDQHPAEVNSSFPEAVKP